MTAPNLFSLHGRHVSVTYSTTGVDGQPRLSYHDPQRAVSFSGGDIEVVDDTPLGSLVTVRLVVVPDLGTTTFTILIPRINAEPGVVTHVETEGITTITRQSFAPQLDQGQIQAYTPVRLSGTAQLVDF
jgi:hypothetical protein